MPCSLIRRALIPTVLGLSTALASVQAASAGEPLSVLSGGAAKSGLGEVVPGYEQSAGIKIAIDYAPMGALVRKLGEGAKPDIVVLTAEVMAEAEKKGWIVPGTTVEVGRVGIGVAVHEQAPAPDISTPEAFKKTLLAAKSIVYINPATGTSGKHLAQVFRDLGIADEIGRKAKLLEGGYVVEPVGRGEIELGLHQITEILPVKGVKLVGPLPGALQKITIYQGAVTPHARDPQAAKSFLAHLRTPAARAAFVRKGYMGD